MCDSWFNMWEYIFQMSFFFQPQVPLAAEVHLAVLCVQLFVKCWCKSQVSWHPEDRRHKKPSHILLSDMRERLSERSEWEDVLSRNGLEKRGQMSEWTHSEDKEDR